MLDPNYSDLLSEFLAHEVRFLVIGAYALGAHGHPRATMDFDVWVAPARKGAWLAAAARKKARPPPTTWSPDQTRHESGPGARVAAGPASRGG
jgi:hypothetical protein